MPLQPHSTWSINDSSKVKDFMACPRLYFYEYVLGWRPESPNNHLHFGTCWHSAMEHLLLNDYSSDSVIEAHELMTKQYREVFPPDTDPLFEPKTPDNALVVLGAYVGRYEDDLVEYKVDHTEIAGTVSMSPERVLHFRMDSILTINSNSLKTSLEHKTGSGLYLWQEQWELDVQIGTYLHVLHCLYGAENVECIYVNGAIFKKAKKPWIELKTKGHTNYQLPFEFIRPLMAKSKNQMQVWFMNMSHYLAEIDREYEFLMKADEGDELLLAFPMRTTSCIRYGRLCEFHDFCNAWPNPLQRAEQPPIGFKEEYWNPMEKEAKYKVEV